MKDSRLRRRVGLLTPAGSVGAGPLVRRRGIGLVAGSLFLLSAVVRWGYFQWHGVKIWPDSLGYLRLAHNLIQYHVYSTSLAPPILPSVPWPPVYPVFIAVFFVFGLSINAIILAQIALDALVTVLIFLVARLQWGTRAALCPAIFYALYPGAILSSCAVLSGSLFTLILIAAVVLLIAGARQPAWISPVIAAVAGAAMGLGVLCRTLGAPCSLAMAGVLVFTGARDVTWRRRLGVLAIFVGAASILVVPYLIRCRVVSGRFVLLQAAGGGDLYVSTLQRDSLTDQIAAASLQPDYRSAQYALTVSGSARDQAYWDNQAGRAAWHKIKEAPFTYLVWRVHRLPHLFLTVFISGPALGRAVRERRIGWIAAKGSMLMIFSLAPFCLGLIGILGEDSFACRLCGACWLATLLALFCEPIEPRYWYPMMPLLLITAGYGVAVLNRVSGSARRFKAGT